MNSPPTATYHHKTHSNHSQTHIESPLRKASFPVDVDGKAAFDGSKDAHAAAHPRSDLVWESETEDDEVHVDAPAFRTSKYTGNGYDPPTENLGPSGGNTAAEGGWIQETGYGVPILASDEVAKEPGSEYLQPAVSPVQERRGSTHYAGIDSDAPPSYQSGYRNQSRPGSASNSRPSSRPGSIHGSLPGLSKFVSHDEREDMHTPLEDVDEYEPLFPEDEDNKEPRSVSATERFTRRENLKRRFPSQDIWEDTPNSLQLQATVETPEPAKEREPAVAPETQETSAVFEPPEREASRKGEIAESEKITPTSREEGRAKPSWNPYLRDEIDRPAIKHRFPSQDIWEESPDSARLETTVEEPQGEEVRSPLDEGVKAGEAFGSSERHDKNNRVEGLEDPSHGERITTEKGGSVRRPLQSSGMSEKPADTGSPAVPSVPARPARRPQVPPAHITSPTPTVSGDSPPTDPKQVSPSESQKGPVVLPDRPKPQIPARPARFAPRDGSETGSLSKSVSMSSTGSGGAKEQSQSVTSPPPQPKPKPVLPARPVGSKIASLKAGFLSDLDKRLQLGPQAPKAVEKTVAEPEPEEKAPLADARKGRARGPARRKPAAPSASAAVAEAEQDGVKPGRSNWGIQEAWTVWQTEDDGTINVVHAARSSSTTKEEREIDDPRSPSGPVASTDSMSARDTPTSSRDEIMPTPDDPRSDNIPPTVQPHPASSFTSRERTDETDEVEQDSENKIIQLHSDQVPTDLNADNHEEGVVVPATD